MTWGRLLIALIGTIGGFLLVWKTEAVFGFTGRFEFAEKYLGTEGGSRLFIKIIGCIVIIVSWMYGFNVGGIIIMKLFLPGRPTEY